MQTKHRRALRASRSRTGIDIRIAKSNGEGSSWKRFLVARGAGHGPVHLAHTLNAVRCLSPKALPPAALISRLLFPIGRRLPSHIRLPIFVPAYSSPLSRIFHSRQNLGSSSASAQTTRPLERSIAPGLSSLTIQAPAFFFRIGYGVSNPFTPAPEKPNLG